MTPINRLRSLHWLLAFSFLAAYLTGDDGELLHVYLGYAGLALLATRLIFTLRGPRGFPPLLPRIADFSRNSSLFISRTLSTLIVLGFLGSAVSGLALVDNAKVLGIAAAAAIPAAQASEHEHDDEERDGGELAGGSAWLGMSGDAWEEIHEFIANGTLLLVGTHLAFVLFRRQKMARTMILGAPRATEAAK